MWKERPATAWTDVTGGESLERNFWKEVQAKNWVELERRLGGTYVYVSPNGSFNRSDTLDRLKQIQLNEYSLGDFVVELNGSTLVVAYTITLRGTVRGQPLPAQPVRMMSVWQQQKAGWMAIAHSSIGNELL